MKLTVLIVMTFTLGYLSLVVADFSEFQKQRMERERRAWEIYLFNTQQNQLVQTQTCVTGHNKQNQMLFTHEQILKGRLPKPR